MEICQKNEDHCYCIEDTVFYTKTTGGQAHRVCCNCGHRRISSGISYPSTPTIVIGDPPYEGNTTYDPSRDTT